MKTILGFACKYCSFKSRDYLYYHFCYALPAVIDSGKYDEKENVDVTTKD